jgi:hypothetical protein
VHFHFASCDYLDSWTSGAVVAFCCLLFPIVFTLVSSRLVIIIPGMCALHLAAKEGHLDVLKALSRAVAKNDQKAAAQATAAALATAAITAAATAAATADTQGAASGEADASQPPPPPPPPSAIAALPLVMFGGLDWTCPCEKKQYFVGLGSKKASKQAETWQVSILEVAAQAKPSAKQKRMVAWLTEQRREAAAASQVELNARQRSDKRFVRGRGEINAQRAAS